MLATIQEYVRLILIAFSDFFDSLRLPLMAEDAGESIASSAGLGWLEDIVNFIIDLLEGLPEVLALFGDEILEYVFYTPLGELILTGTPIVFIIYALVAWIIDILP